MTSSPPLARLRWLFVIARNSTFIYKARRWMSARSRTSSAFTTFSTAACAPRVDDCAWSRPLDRAETGKHNLGGKNDRHLQGLFAVPVRH